LHIEGLEHYPNILTVEEEEELLQLIDCQPWQSGVIARRQQFYEKNSSNTVTTSHNDFNNNNNVDLLEMNDPSSAWNLKPKERRNPVHEVVEVVGGCGTTVTIIPSHLFASTQCHFVISG
jgi:hypothetical protein